MPQIIFQPGNHIVEAEKGETLLKAARRGGIHINASCGGAGVCGKCKVMVRDGAVEGGSGKHLSDAEWGAGKRQACTALVQEDTVTVELPKSGDLTQGALGVAVPVHQKAGAHSFCIDELKREGVFLPPVEKLFLELPRATAADNMADAARVVLGLHNQYDVWGSLSLCRYCGGCGRRYGKMISG